MNITAPAIQARDLSDRVTTDHMHDLLSTAKVGRLVIRNSDTVITPSTSHGLYKAAYVYAVATALYFDWIVQPDGLTDTHGNQLYAITAAGLTHLGHLIDQKLTAAGR